AIAAFPDCDTRGLEWCTTPSGTDPLQRLFQSIVGILSVDTRLMNGPSDRRAVTPASIVHDTPEIIVTGLDSLVNSRVLVIIYQYDTITI
ncbi:MAG: hypothetical protein O6930_04985, partial [Gammaproteobacteria bacterium]|nr:hypothetical protein [Gammaproteobacteria bacterium]